MISWIRHSCERMRRRAQRLSPLACALPIPPDTNYLRRHRRAPLRMPNTVGATYLLSATVHRDPLSGARMSSTKIPAPCTGWPFGRQAPLTVTFTTEIAPKPYHEDYSMKVYFATNRNLVVRKSTPVFPSRGPKFGIHPSDFRVGTAIVEIRRGDPVDGERLDDTVHYRSAQIEPERRNRNGRFALRGSQNLFRDMSEDLIPSANNQKEGPRRSLLVFIPGFNNSFEESIEGGAALANLYSSHDHHLIPFVFSWPSDGEFGTYYYRSDRKDSEASGDAGARVLERFLRYVNMIGSAEQCSLSAFLVTHSMGAYVLRFSLRELVRRNYPLAPFFNIALLIAADVDYDALEKSEKLLPIGRLTREVVVYANKNDKALIKATDLNDRIERMGLAGPASRAHELLPIPLSTVLCHKADNFANRNNSGHHYYRHSVVGVKDIKAVLNQVDPDEIPNRKEVRPDVYRLNSR